MVCAHSWLTTSLRRTPEWIDAATNYSVQIRAGSTTLDLHVPRLLEAAPEEFRQLDAFPDIDPELSCFNYFSGSLEAAVEGDDTSRYFDKGLLTEDQGSRRPRADARVAGVMG